MSSASVALNVHATRAEGRETVKTRSTRTAGGSRKDPVEIRPGLDVNPTDRRRRPAGPPLSSSR